ncbi:MAG TPA: SpaH/EbpB family LPXTG-anchored major pilin [Microbacteriaceae bacterium]|nr:SpaH/EbpB family LPXTG-anchored major pilin [Microbacteriaceae bacterium]
MGAFVAASALLIGGSVAANAAPFPIPEESAITITKWSQPVEPGENATGTVATMPTGAEPISGVVFTDYQVPISATAGTNAWQQEIAGMDTTATLTALGGAGFPDAAATHAFPATDLNGVTTWSNAPWGLYYVVEDATNASTSVAESTPFLIAVPMTDPDARDAWLDHIYVYPKNSKIDAEKSVNDSGAIQTGDNVTWTITSDVPRIENGVELIAAESFVITDALDPRLTYVSAVAEVIDSAGASIVGTDQLIAGDDYTVDGAGVSITFTTTGLVKLLTAASNDGQRVKVTLITSVDDATPDATTGTAIKNNATVVTNDSLPNEITATTNEAQTNWGVISFTKKSAAGGDLEGATFELYSSEADSVSDTATPLLTAQTSVANGGVSFNGVRTSDTVNGVVLSDPADYQVYWLRETVAPADHQLLAEPIAVLLMSDGNIYTFTPDTNGQPTLDAAAPAGVTGGALLTEILNVQNATGFVLPLTGGMGTVFLTIIVLAIVGSVVFIVRRRNEEAAH